MADEHPRWDGNPEGVDHFLQIVACSDAPHTDRLTSVLAAAASCTSHTDPHGEERFLAEYHAAEPEPAQAKPRYRSLRVAIPATLATLTLTAPASPHPRPQ